MAFGTLLLCAIAALSVLLAWRDYQGAIEKGEANALSSAHVVAAHFQWMLQASDQALRRIDSALGPEAIGETANTVFSIEEAIGDLPRGFQYSVYDETGQLRFSSVKEAIGINVSDREYFQELRDGSGIVISPLLDERLSNESVFVVARRIVRSGEFHGAASIAIPAARMAGFWSSMNLGPFSSVSVIRTDGWLVARFPALGKTMDLSNTPLLDAARAQSGVYHSGTSPVDGKARIVGFWRVDGAPVIAVAGIERGEVLAAFWRNLLTGAVIAVPLIGMLAWGLVGTARLQRADEARRRDLERSLEHNRFLLREIHHRIKNNLQTVASLVRLQPLPAEARQSIAGRISAMVAVHEHIYQNDEYGDVSVDRYLHRLIDDLREGSSNDVEMEVEIDPLLVDRDHALPLGLLVNEIVSNAFKHAFKGASSGRIKISLSMVSDREARLTISDNGRGFNPDSAPQNMGSKLVAAFASQLKGEVKTESSKRGTTFTLTFPITN
ncbi:histidine kinase dimerization/phosphoacceptor domain -containing protein [Mesorhizobium sp. WSM2239]|uniref:histidine kinase n=2 Tax=unclassified Mesorhizobium TaxID=325217 RepID=A0AAU8DCG4_9HYPH